MSKTTGYERFMVPSIHNIPGVQAKAAFLIDSSSVFREQEIEAVLLDSDSSESACRDLMELALSRGAPDNVTIIVWKR